MTQLMRRGACVITGNDLTPTTEVMGRRIKIISVVSGKNNQSKVRVKSCCVHVLEN